ncbi:unnamed protein product, partial [Closterium sp. NIES-65]
LGATGTQCGRGWIQCARAKTGMQFKYSAKLRPAKYRGNPDKGASGIYLFKGV